MSLARAAGLGVRGVIRRGLFLLLLACAPGLAVAAAVRVVLSDDAAPYQEVFEALRTQLAARDVSVERVYADAPSDAATAARLWVVVGVRAAEAVANWRGRTPVLAVLVPRDWYLKTGRARLAGAERRPVSAIYLDQPFERQARLIRLAFPGAKKLGVLLSPGQAGLADEIEAALRGQGLGLVAEIVSSEQKLVEPLERVFTAADVLLAVPDPEIFNRSTAQTILLTSYRYRDPVVGYSQSLARAGAMLSLYSTPAQIGRQAAEVVARALEAPHGRLPPPEAPAEFTLSINRQVARSLGLDLPPESELLRRLQGGGDD
jgi:hypothetical protein